MPIEDGQGETNNPPFSQPNSSPNDDFEELLGAPFIESKLNTSNLETIISVLNQRLHSLEFSIQRSSSRNTKKESTKLLPDPQSTEPEPEIPKPLLPPATEVLDDKWEEAKEDQSDKFNVLYDMLRSTISRLDKLSDDISQNNAIQALKDDAQDELMSMEFDGYDRKLNQVLKHKDLKEAMNMIDSQSKGVESSLRRRITEVEIETQEILEAQLSKVIRQLKIIEKANEEQDKLMEERVRRILHKEMGNNSPNQNSGVAAGSRGGGGGGGVGGGNGGRDKGGGENHSQFMKMKKSINQMELAQANDKIKLGRIQAMCDSAAERAQKAEAVAEEVRDAIKKGDDDVTTRMNAEIEERLEQLSNQIFENTESSENTVKEQLMSMTKEFDDKLVSETNRLTEELIVKSDESIKHASILSSKVMFLEENQSSMIKEMTIQTLQESASTDKAEMQQVSEDVQNFKLILSTAQIQAKTESEAATVRIDKLEESLKKHSADELDLMRKDAKEQTRDFNDKFNDVSSSSNSNKVLATSLGEDIFSLKDLIASTVASLQNDAIEAASKLASQAYANKSMFDSSIDDLNEAANANKAKLEEEIQDINDENIAMQSAISDIADDITKLATKEEVLDAIETKLTHHVKALAKLCSNFEEALSSNIPPSIQRYLSGNTQRIAKLIATKADYEIIRRIIVHADPSSFDWDVEVTSLRTEYKNKFIKRVKDAAHQKRPTADEASRSKFVTKLDLALKIAISKYARIQIGTTLLGRRQLTPTCMACDRPFGDENHSSNGNGGGRSKTPGGDMRAMNPISKEGSLSSIGGGGFDDDSTIATIESSSSRARSVAPFGVEQKKYIYRGGFKLPISSPVTNGNDMDFDDDNSIGSIGSIGSLERAQSVGFSADDNGFGSGSGSGSRASPKNRFNANRKVWSSQKKLRGGGGGGKDNEYEIPLSLNRADTALPVLTGNQSGGW